MSLSLSGDASYLVSCASGDEDNRGACWVFIADGGSYKQLGTKIVSGLRSGTIWFGKCKQDVAENLDL